MRVYNGTNSSVSLPLYGTQRITIAPHSVSGNIMGGVDFINVLTTSYKPTELLIIVSGPLELNLCAGIPSATEYVVQSLDEAVLRFKKEDEEIEEKKECECECEGDCECGCDENTTMLDPDAPKMMRMSECCESLSEAMPTRHHHSTTAERVKAMGMREKKK